MNWKAFWQKQGQQNDALLQVGRRGGQSLQGEEWLDVYAKYLVELIEITPNDTVLDMCCGNGMLTHKLGKYCKAILGVDFSETHIAFANKRYASDKIKFICADALGFESIQLTDPLFEKGFNHSVLCFSFQYFESVARGLQIVKGLCSHTRKSVFLGDIPDSARFFVYYDSPLKLLRLAKQMLLHKNDMGKFWSENELDFIARQVNKKGQKRIQPADFPYAHYRMDYLIMDLPPSK